MSANPAESVGAGIEVVAGSLTLIVSDAEVGVWPLAKVGVEVEEDGFHVLVDGEEFVFVTREAEEFARAVGVLDQPTNRRKKPKAVKANGHQAAPTPSRTRTKPAKVPKYKPAKASKRIKAGKPARPARPARALPSLPEIDFRSRNTQLALAGLVLVAVMGIFAAPLLAFLMMGAGSIGLLFGTGSLIDPIMATRLPDELSPSRLILVSVLLLITGMMILTIG